MLFTGLYKGRGTKTIKFCIEINSKRISGKRVRIIKLIKLEVAEHRNLQMTLPLNIGK